MTSTPFKVAVYLYPNADILDFSGPTEIYSCRPFEGPRLFEITSFAHHNPVQSESGALTYVPNATFKEVETKIEEFDVLLIPGAAADGINAVLKSEEGKELCALLRKFVASRPTHESGQRILHSVCSGAVLLAASGVLAGRTVTTHHLVFDTLKQVADEAAGGDSKTNVVRRRWVDAGTTEAGVRIVNAGGVSSGIDSTLWIVEQLAGKKAADWAAEIAEFERRPKGWNE
ncbi:class I glutamine amidotransferase-like protein [Paraphoma chrysanthemicola]|uniref:Class I glutamine amidotransferase-like protein n=1 Tax=Paraphoma chrysanthemicola TaxID=798071 RepID=A0A8K0QSN9_9PLEO|nr:class I glutamine amidotransferase-like protein [Paraphoma chrysanthemicola]